LRAYEKSGVNDSEVPRLLSKPVIKRTLS